MPYYKFLLATFGVVNTIALVGIIFVLVKKGFYPCEDICLPPDKKTGGECFGGKIKDPNDPKCVLGGHKLSIITISACFMFGSFLVPFILRPIDFFSNMIRYILGLTTYLLMLPYFSIIIPIFSMCNLHDISWGNRPAGAQGMEAVTYNKKRQDQLALEYQIYRSNFFYFWILANSIFAIFVLVISGVGGDKSPLNAYNFLNVFACLLASLIAFKFFAALLYIIKWNCRACYGKNSKIY